MNVQKRFTLSVIFISLMMASIFAVSWYREKGQVTILTIATGSKQGQYYAFAQALAEVINRHNPQLRIQVLETEGAQQNKELLNQHKVQLALLQSDTSIEPSMQMVSFLFPEMFHLIATKQSGIGRVSDLKGKKIALMPKGSGSYTLFWSLIQHYGLKPTDFEAVLLPPEEAHAALQTGKVDALFRVVAVGNSSVVQLMQNPNIQLIPIDQGAALQLFLPALEESRIPKGAYNGSVPIPPTDLPVVAVRAILVTDKNVEQKYIYEITRILHESRNELVEKTTVVAMIKQPDVDENIGFAFHPGAIAYYERSKPGFLVEYADTLGLFFSIGVLGISGLWQLRSWLQNNQKNRADFYNLEILKLVEKINLTHNLEELEAVRLQLFDIFEKVVCDLDQDKISSESFQSFTFPWEVAMSTVRHQETILMNSRLSQLESFKSLHPSKSDKNNE